MLVFLGVRFVVGFYFIFVVVVVLGCGNGWRDGGMDDCIDSQSRAG